MANVTKRENILPISEMKNVTPLQILDTLWDIKETL